MKRRIDRSVVLLVGANVLVLAILVGFFVSDRIEEAREAARATPSAQPSKDLMAMGPAHIPTSNACILCHTTGGAAGLKAVPALGHPLEGWSSCLTCHTNDKLGRLAPGHQGIDESECTNCHKVAQPGPAITQAHSKLDRPCLDCHGNVAHLPSSMVGRNQDDCSLCHQPNPSEPPQKPHPWDGRISCRTCHSSTDVGALPIDHALRADDTCILCHDIQATEASPYPTFGPLPSLPTFPIRTPAPQAGALPGSPSS